jgi:hypothetical protein
VLGGENLNSACEKRFTAESAETAEKKQNKKPLRS